METEVFDPDFDELEQLACGELGLAIDYLYGLTPRQFVNILTGFRNKEYEAHKDSWEQTRMQMYASLLPYSSQKELSPKDVLLFPWEEQEKVRIIKSMDEVDKLI